MVCVGVGGVVSRSSWELTGELARPLSCGKHCEGMGGVNGSSQFLALRAAKWMEGIDEVRSSPAPLRVMLCKQCGPMRGSQLEMHKTPTKVGRNQELVMLPYATIRRVFLQNTFAMPYPPTPGITNLPGSRLRRHEPWE